MGRSKHTFLGVCQACMRESEFTYRDHRTPKRLGGDDSAWNMQDLCIECHSKKSGYEHVIMTFNADSESLRQWFWLAFQNDAQRIKHFIDHMHLRLGHMKEVQQELAERRGGEPCRPSGGGVS